MEWISVEDRLPEDVDIYIVRYRSGGRWLSLYMPRKKTWMDIDIGVEEMHVTHWMPLPEPPK